MSDEIDSLEALRDSIVKALSGASFGRVETFDEATQTAKVQPFMTRLVRDVDTDHPLEPEALPVRHVRVLSLQASGFALVFPLAPGDSVLLLTLEGDHGPHELNGGEADPLDWRRHHAGSCVALPLALARALVPSVAGEAWAAGRLVLGGGARKNTMSFHADGIELGGPDPDPIALGPAVRAALNAIVTWSATATAGTLSGALTPLIGAIDAQHVKAK